MVRTRSRGTSMSEQQRILCIDGDEDFRHAVSGRFAAEGFAITAAASKTGGLTAAASSSFDLILLDMRLAEQDSLATYQALRTHPTTRHAPMILVTALAAADYWEALPYDTDGLCFVMGRSDDVDLLLARITQLLAEGTITW